MGSDQKVFFTDTREVVTIELPSFPGSKVEIYTEFNVWQQREIAGKAKNDQEKGVFMVLAAIKSWNLYQDETTPLPITEEVINKFKDPDIIPLFAAVLKVTPEEFVEKFQNGGALKKNIAG